MGIKKHLVSGSLGFTRSVKIYVTTFNSVFPNIVPHDSLVIAF